MEFEWDPDKAIRNLAKHGTSFAEAATVFGDSRTITFADPDHSIDEDRYPTFGHSVGEHPLVVSQTDREDCIRLIGTRRASRGREDDS